MAIRKLVNAKTGEVTTENFDFTPPPATAESKKAEVHAFVALRSAALANPLDALRMAVITGLQGDRARGNQLSAPQQAILDAAESDARKPMVESLLIASEDIILNIETIADVKQAFTDRGVI